MTATLICKTAHTKQNSFDHESISREYTRNIFKERSCVIVYIYIIRIKSESLAESEL